MDFDALLNELKVNIDEIESAGQKNEEYFGNYENFLACLESGNFEILNIFPIEFFSDEIIDKYLDELVEGLPFIFGKMCDHEGLCHAVAEKYPDKLNYHSSVLTREFFQQHKEKLGTLITKVDSFYADSQEKFSYLLDVLLEYHRYDLISSFSAECFTDEIIKKYSSDIIANSPKVPNIIINSYEDFLKKRSFDDIYFLTIGETELETFKNKFLDPQYNFTSEMYDSDLLFKFVLKNKAYNLLNKFYSGLFTDENLKDYIDEIMDSFDNYNNINFSISNSNIFRKKVLERKELNKINYFTLTKEEIKDNLDYILELEEWPLGFGGDNNLFIACLENGRFDRLNDFYNANVTDDIVSLYGQSLIDTQEKYPMAFKQNSKFLILLLKNKKYNQASGYMNYLSKEDFEENKELINEFLNLCKANNIIGKINNKYILIDILDNKKFDYIDIFDERVFDDTIIDKYFDLFIEQTFMDSAVPQILFSNELFIEKCRANNCNFALLTLKLPDDILSNPDELKYYSKILNTSVEELKFKISYLLLNNDEVLNTIFPLLLSNEFNSIDYNNYSRICNDFEIQKMLIKLNKKEFEIVSIIIKSLNSDEYDIAPIIYDILKKIKKCERLVNLVNPDELTEENIRMLSFVLQSGTASKWVLSTEDLTFEKYNTWYENGHSQIVELFKTQKIDIAKCFVYEKVFGLTLSRADFIYNRYCFDLDMVLNSELPEEIKKILESIRLVHDCEDVNLLLELYEKNPRKNVDDLSSLALESAIRKSYTKLYRDTLYNPKESDLTRRGITYRGNEITMYEINDDFNMQVHALGAYSNYSRPDNFKNEWLQPKIANHGICTSYIGNNQIATARAYHPILGFSTYEDSAVLLSAPYDIGSSRYNGRYNTSMLSSCMFTTPDKMIDYTRHTHNEMVIERRAGNNAKHYKRTPDYVVLIVDDANDVENFMTRKELKGRYDIDDDLFNELVSAKDKYTIDNICKKKNLSENIKEAFDISLRYEETLQASIDFGVPIVLIDRLKFAKREQAKCEALKEEFLDGNSSAIKDLIKTYTNNIIGCIRYEGNPKSEYQDYFNNEGLDALLNELYDDINTFDSDYYKLLCLYELIDSLKLEEELRVNNKGNIENRNPSLMKYIDYFEPIATVYDMRFNEIADYMETLEDTEQIEEDLYNLSFEEILKNIEEGIYKSNYTM